MRPRRHAWRASRAHPRRRDAEEAPRASRPSSRPPRAWVSCLNSRPPRRTSPSLSAAFRRNRRCRKASRRPARGLREPAAVAAGAGFGAPEPLGPPSRASAGGARRSRWWARRLRPVARSSRSDRRRRRPPSGRRKGSRGAGSLQRHAPGRTACSRSARTEPGRSRPRMRVVRWRRRPCRCPRARTSEPPILDRYDE